MKSRLSAGWKTTEAAEFPALAPAQPNPSDGELSRGSCGRGVSEQRESNG